MLNPMPVKQRYFLRLSFKGTNYHGWQLQENAETIQGILENVISLKLSESISLTGAGRTDTGVHASNYYAHFESIKPDIDKIQFIKEVNRFLPHDIALHDLIKVNPDHHTRFDATERTYKYYIQRKKNPFNFDTTYYYTGELDVELMNQCAKALLKYQDFESFCRAHSDNKTFICDIKQAEWELKDDQLIFTISADRFLRNMVRAIVGTLLDCGRNKIDINTFCQIIEKKDRSSASASAPAKGLFLFDIKYPYI
jgi:tRNA pseudouridine38-40 synthase